MNEFDKELVFSEAVKAGKRIYYFDVKQSRNGDRYISITESKKIVDGPSDDPHFKFEKHKLFLYKEDYDKFIEAFIRTIKAAKSGIAPTPQPMTEEAQAPAEPTDVASSETNTVSTEADAEGAEADAASTESEASEAQTPDGIATEAHLSAPKEEEDSFKIDLDF